MIYFVTSFFLFFFLFKLFFVLEVSMSSSSSSSSSSSFDWRNHSFRVILHPSHPNTNPNTNTNTNLNTNTNTNPLPNSTYRFNRRFYLPLESINSHSISTGDLFILQPTLQLNHLSLQQTPSHPASPIPFTIGIAWPSTTLEKQTIAISIDHLINADVQIGDFVNIIPLPPILSPTHIGPGRGIRLPQAKKITLKEITHLDQLSASNRDLFRPYIHHASQAPFSLRDLKPLTIRMWEGFIREVLVDRKYLAIHHYISIPFANSLRLFSVHDIQPTTLISHSTSNDTPPKSSSSSSPSLELYVIDRATQLDLISSSIHQKPSKFDSTPLDVHPGSLHSPSDADVGYDAIGGLNSQVEQIRELIELPLTRPDLYSHFRLVPPRGILLHGPPGTGKTLLASIIAKSIKSTILKLSTHTISSAYHGEAEQRIHDLFTEAKSKSPSIIIIDEIDGLFPSRDVGGEVDRRLVGTLLSCMDGIDEKISASTSKEEADGKQSIEELNQNPRVIVLATTNRPHTLDSALRRPGRFDREFEIGIPNSSARLSILNVLLTKIPNNLSDEYTKSIADKTHGFVGADLASLIREAGMIAIKRSINLTTPTTPLVEMEQLKLESDDIDKGLMKIRPSGMREVYIETPKVRWEDIGGQKEIKQRLIEAVEWPLKYSNTFKRLGIKPTRGLLLYGPPGCSKTLIAKALAFESRFNFISIKGSDVFNKFLGESEKSIRDLFRKARANSPSIVFLDEIDSIAMARGGDQDQRGGDSNSVGDRVLTSLLTEIDGVEELHGVLVLAATNRPDVIDSALLRPGRIDRILYVGLPDLNDRIEIFKINFNKMMVSNQVRIDHLASLTDGYTGAEIVSICQDAAINAMHRDVNVDFIEEDDFLSSINKFTKRTDPKSLKFFKNWSNSSGLESA